MSSAKPSTARASDRDNAATTSSADFEAYYLRRVTSEFAEDLDKVRRANDFKNDAVPLLVHALRQGTALFSPEDQRRIASAAAAAAADGGEAGGKGRRGDGDAVAGDR